MNEILKLTGVALIVGCLASSFDIKGMNERPGEAKQAGQSVAMTSFDKGGDAEVKKVPLGEHMSLYINKNQSQENIRKDIYTQALNRAKEDTYIVGWLAYIWSFCRAKACYDRVRFSLDNNDGYLEEVRRSGGFTIGFGDNEELLNVGKSIIGTGVHRLQQLCDQTKVEEIDAPLLQILCYEINAKVHEKLSHNRDKAIEIFVEWYADAATEVTKDQ